MKLRRKSLALPALVTALLAAAAVPADAELVQRGNLFVTFSGGISPVALPRRSLAPIAVRVTGRIRTLRGGHLPSLRHVRIALSRAGHLDTRGLPVCPIPRVTAAPTRAALEACGSALVGTGAFTARVALPEQRPLPSHGRIVAFNSARNGHRIILAHVYSIHPLPIVRIIVFHLHRGRGAFGTILTGGLPKSVIRWGYVKRIALELHRRFTYRGRAHSYLSAACAAPEGFREAVFPFARASMAFADGRTLSSTLTRSCRVRG